MTNITKGKKKRRERKKRLYKLEGLLKSKSVFYVFLIKIVPSQSKVGEV